MTRSDLATHRDSGLSAEEVKEMLNLLIPPCGWSEVEKVRDLLEALLTRLTEQEGEA